MSTKEVFINLPEYTDHSKNTEVNCFDDNCLLTYSRPRFTNPSTEHPLFPGKVMPFTPPCQYFPSPPFSPSDIEKQND
jgi:hypothetical protein